MFTTRDQQGRELMRFGATSMRAATGTAMPTLIGAAMIAAAILLSTFVGAVGNRYEGLEGRNEDSA